MFQNVIIFVIAAIQKRQIKMKIFYIHQNTSRKKSSNFDIEKNNERNTDIAQINWISSLHSQ